MLYIGDVVRIKANNKHNGKQGTIVSKTNSVGVYGKALIKYRIQTGTENLYFKEKYLELVKAKDDDSLLEWIGRGSYESGG